MTSAGGDRRAELEGALAALHRRIALACAASGRSSEEIELVAVTKTRPADDVALLVDLGLGLFGENRPQEAESKVRELEQLRPGADASWHLVGRLQRNKARAVARWAARVESVDSVRLVDALDTAARAALENGYRAARLRVLLQVSLDGDPGRGGALPEHLLELAERVSAAEGLELDGVMAVAPLETDSDAAFAALAKHSARLRESFPDATVVSAGMSGDLERAIQYGSTCLRVGTALLGDRRLASP
jgi:hypothetical protein